jgi:NhaA family Na+:H+ antiporter
MSAKKRKNRPNHEESSASIQQAAGGAEDAFLDDSVPLLKPSQAERRAEELLRPFQDFLHKETSGGVLLFLCTIMALVWANSAWGSGYDHLVHEHLSVGFGSWSFDHELHYWINDGLMAIFFFVVGLEIKREFLVGELSTFRKALLPIGAAVGGMVAPAIVYAAFNRHDPIGLRGWAMPMATDIAFAVGVIALLGRRVPDGLKVFLVALAIVDDLGAVAVIAVFYTEQIHWWYLGIGAVITAGLVVGGRSGVRDPFFYGLLGGLLWYCFLKSGIHATLAGVVAAMTVPTRARLDPRLLPQEVRGLAKKLEDQTREQGVLGQGLLYTGQYKTLKKLKTAVTEAKSPLQRFEQSLHGWVAFLVMPIFALFNAGVHLSQSAMAALISVDPRGVAVGAAAGLVIGKQVGVFAASWLMVKLGLASLPTGVTWRHMYGAAWLTGIGFTMSLFISGLAFQRVLDRDLATILVSEAKMGIMFGSLICGFVGFAILRAGKPPGEEA